MNQEVLEIILGIIFIVLGGAIVIRLKILTKSKYYRYLFIATAILLISFGIYLISRSIYIYE